MNTLQTAALRPFVLPDDVLFVPLESFSPSVRRALGTQAGTVTITRPGYRCPSRVVDDDTAALLQCFRPARSIVDAVLQFSAGRRVDPIRTLDQAFETLKLFAASRILVPEDSEDAKPLSVSWAPGQIVADFEIVELLQHTRDSEIYRIKMKGDVGAALKIERSRDLGAREFLMREAEILRRLNGTCATRLLREGILDGRVHLIVEWVPGVPITHRAARLRSQGSEGMPALLRLLTRMLAAFAQIHQRGVVHGDIHGQNILVDLDDNITVIDFGLSRVEGAGALLDHTLRGGFGWYLDPQSANSLLSGGLPDAANAQAEQYCLSALAYQLFTGASYIELAPRVEQMQRQIIEEPPRSFLDHGIRGWGSLEAVLRRGLCKDPAGRFDSLEEMHSALSRCRPPSDLELDRDFETFSSESVDRFLSRDESSLHVETPFRAPTSSADQGAAGWAWLHYRIGVLRSDPRALAVADIWARRARLALSSPDAFAPPTEDSLIEDVSVVHRAPGVHWVGAKTCLARADFVGFIECAQNFVASAQGASTSIDLTLGKAGVLCAAVTLLEDCRQLVPAPKELSDFALHLYDELSSALELDEPPGLIHTQPASFAHGWPGLLFALLQASVILNQKLGRTAIRRVKEVTMLIESTFPLSGRIEDVPGWCNGAAGQLWMFLAAHRVLGDERYLDAAHLAAKRTADHPDQHAHFCCGLAGRVLALLGLYRHCGEPFWLKEARHLARRLEFAVTPASCSNPRHSLFWGEAGVALAIEEARFPGWTTLPFFGV